ncbi:MAG: hypothetical protein GY768_09385 [Planctomycetaceae bacterium]|nr:hypothetical protein [Planctomycetaceae bacterium]
MFDRLLEFAKSLLSVWHGEVFIQCDWLNAAVGRGVVTFGWLLMMPMIAHAARGSLELRAIDSKSQEPTAIYLVLRNSKGRPIFAPKQPRIGDGFVFDGQVVLELHPGLYTFEADKGPEYRQRTGHFVMKSGATDNQEIEMQRFVHMSEEDWWSGDLHVERPLRELPLLMLASDLHFANVVTWSNQKNVWDRKPQPKLITERVGRDRFYQVMGGRERRAGSEMVFGRLQQPLPFESNQIGEYPTPFQSLRRVAKQGQSHTHLNRMDCRDLPVWLASGKVDSLGLLHPGLLPEGSSDASFSQGRDPVLFPEPHGVARWSQQIYFRLLNAGFKIPPAAGSGAGVNASPIGYNRVYVHSEQPFTPQSWWDGLRAGRVLLTNGPLLRPRVNGRLPGHVFHATGERLELEIEAKLGTREKIDYFEVIKNGRSEMQVRLEDWVSQEGRLPPVIFEQSGWIMIRVVTRNQQTYRCACSGPFYVTFQDQPHVSRQACQFFVDWLYERAGEIRLKDPQQQSEVMRYHRAARDFWQQRLATSNRD